ncbi:hypothetical protein FRC18_001404, partial [Serendipita sp. 400]
MSMFIVGPPLFAQTCPTAENVMVQEGKERMCNGWFKFNGKFLEYVGLRRIGQLGSVEHVLEIKGIDIIAHAALAGVYKWSQTLIRNLEDEFWVGEFRRMINLPL